MAGVRRASSTSVGGLGLGRGGRLVSSSTTLTLLQAATVSPAGHVLFYGRSESRREEGVWLSSFGAPGLVAVAIDGQDIDGDTIATPLPSLTDNVPGVVNADGVVALKVTMRSGGASILRFQDGVLEVAAASNDLPSGTTVGDAAWLNGQGRVAFSDGNSVFVETAAGLQRVVGLGDVFGLITVDRVDLIGWYDDGTASMLIRPMTDPTPTLGPVSILYWNGSTASVVAAEADEALSSEASGQLLFTHDPMPGGPLSREYLVGPPSGPPSFHTEMDNGIGELRVAQDGGVVGWGAAGEGDGIRAALLDGPAQREDGRVLRREHEPLARVRGRRRDEPAQGSRARSRDRGRRSA